MDKNIIIYIGNFSFPFGNASGKRVYGNGKLLREAGYETIFVGMKEGLSSETTLEATKKEFDGFEYYNFPYPRGSKDWIDYKGVFKKFIHWIQDKKDVTAAIICYGSPRLSIFISKLSHWARQHDIKIISDCVDWLESKTGNLIFDVAKTFDTYYQKAIANKRVDGVICISSYLAEYYKKAGKRTVIIPPLSDHISQKIPQKAQSAVQMVYAGSPFRKKVEVKDLATLKDRVDKMIDILKVLKDEGIEFKFYYFGLDKENYLTAFPGQTDAINYLGDNVVFCGFQDNSVVTKKVAEADFTFLVRDRKKSTMAGFATKVSESISYGTPVITTRTSDIDTYLADGEQALFVDANDLTESARMMKDVFLSQKYKYMKEKCIGNTIFYYKTFAKDMQNFLESLS